MFCLQIDQSLGSCLEDCNKDARYPGEFFKCADGACIKTNSAVCTGSKKCRGGEDETVEICLKVSTEWGETEWIPGYGDSDVYSPKADTVFPCPTKAGELILPELVS